MKYTFTIELKGLERVEDGYRVQMNGHSDNEEQILEEISNLPQELGIEMAILVKKIWGDETGSDTSEGLAASFAGMFHDGYLEGIKEVGCKDNKEIIK